MRLSGFGKLCVISGLALVVMIGLAGSTTQASTGLLQATSTTTGTGTTNNMSMTAASTAMMSGTMAATMSSMTGAACPASVSGVTVATASATTGSAVMSATMDATSSAGASGPGYIGIRVAAIDDCGVRVAGVIAGSPAVTGGLQVGDVIIAVNGTALSTVFGGSTGTMMSGSATMAATSSLGSAATAAFTGNTTATNSANTTAFFNYFQTTYTSGQTVSLTVQRAGQQLNIPITLGTIPAGLVTPVGGTAATTAATAAK